MPRVPLISLLLNWPDLYLMPGVVNIMSHDCSVENQTGRLLPSPLSNVFWGRTPVFESIICIAYTAWMPSLRSPVKANGKLTFENASGVVPTQTKSNRSNMYFLLRGFFHAVDFFVNNVICGWKFSHGLQPCLETGQILSGINMCVMYRSQCRILSTSVTHSV